MQSVTATRSQLLEMKQQLELAARGRDLLEEKRDQLLREFRKVADLVLAHEGALGRAVGAAIMALARAESFDGPDLVRSAAAVTGAGIDLDSRTVHIMGTTIVEIDHGPIRRSVVDRGYSMASTSARIDRAADSFEEVLELALDLADQELRMRILIEAIRTTTRRANALDNIVIPELTHQTAAITSILDERERQDRFRLKLAKQARDRHRRSVRA